MKIKLLDPGLTVTLQGTNIKLAGGYDLSGKPRIYDVDDATAKRLIESNMAVEVTETEAVHENQDA